MKEDHPMKDWLRISKRFFNPSRIGMIEMTSTEPLKVKIHEANKPGEQAWELEGEDAEIALKAIGYGKEEREKEAKEKAEAEQKAQEEAEQKAREEEDRLAQERDEAAATEAREREARLAAVKARAKPAEAQMVGEASGPEVGKTVTTKTQQSAGRKH